MQLTEEQRETLRLALGYIGSSDRSDRMVHVERLRALLAAHNDGAQGGGIAGYFQWDAEKAIYEQVSPIHAPDADVVPLYAQSQPITDAARDALVKRIERHRLDINRGDTVFRCGVNAGLDLVLHELRAAEIERGEREGRES